MKPLVTADKPQDLTLDEEAHKAFFLKQFK